MSGIWAKYNLRLAEKPLQTKTLTVRVFHLLLGLFRTAVAMLAEVLGCQ